MRAADHLRVVLVATRNPLNIGAAARAMSNFDVTHLRVVNPYGVAFREARSAVGAASLLANAKEFASLAEAVTDCSLVVGTTAATRRNLHQELKPLLQGAGEIRGHLGSAPVAIVFGSEKRGLSNEDLSHCNWLMDIPTREEHRSMNLGQSVAVCLYELIRDNVAVQEQPAKLATAAELDRVTAGLLDVLCASGYINPSSGGSAEQKVRRLVRRLALEPGDAETILGMLRQISWKLHSSEKG